jgi:hypothetical protein
MSYKDPEKAKIAAKARYKRDKEKRQQSAKEWHLRDKDHAKLVWMKARLKKRYNITLDCYNEIYNRQDGKCAICKVVFLELKDAPHVDHDHQTDLVRGLLCNNCNWGLGQFKDNLDNLLSAIEYLRNHHGTTH